MSLDQLYGQVILDHARARHGSGPVDPATALGHSHQFNPVCGDDIIAEVVASDAGMSVRWSGDGCSISMASASVASEIFAHGGPGAFLAAEAQFHALMHGEAQPDEAVLQDAVAFSGVNKFPARIKCALLAWIAVKDALLQAQGTGQTEGGRHD